MWSTIESEPRPVVPTGGVAIADVATTAIKTRISGIAQRQAARLERVGGVGMPGWTR